MCSIFEKALAAHEELAAPLCFSELLTLQDKMETDAPYLLFLGSSQIQMFFSYS